MTIKIAPNGAVAKLREDNAAMWEAAVKHKFVQEIFSDSVDKAVMKCYLIQDYQFFEHVVNQLRSLVSLADTSEAKERFDRQLNEFLGPENTYFERALDQLAASEEERRQPVLKSPTKEFLGLADKTISRNSYAVILAFFVVAEWLYLDWATSSNATPESWIHADWVHLHRGPEFEAWVQFLIDELERVYVPETADEVSNMFSQCVRLENEFFDAAYTK